MNDIWSIPLTTLFRRGGLVAWHKVPVCTVPYVFLGFFVPYTKCSMDGVSSYEPSLLLATLNPSSQSRHSKGSSVGVGAHRPGTLYPWTYRLGDEESQKSTVTTVHTGTLHHTIGWSTIPHQHDSRVIFYWNSKELILKYIYSLPWYKK